MTSYISFKTSGKRVAIGEEGEAHILRSSIRYDCELPYRCAGGRCGTCKLHVESGMENLSKVNRAEMNMLGDLIQEGYRLGCQTYAYGDCEVTWDPNAVKGRQLQKLKEFWEKYGDTDKVSAGSRRR